jgi:hypothetical protein
MRTHRVIENERGIALVVVLLVVLAVAAIIAGAAMLGSNTSLINRHQARLSVLETVADAGLEEARSRINGDKTQYPDSGYSIVEAGATVYASDGSVIPNVKRWLYVGPSGVTTGQYGVFGSIVAVAQDPQGNRVVRRGEVFQESFSKYAYFTTIEGAIQFANGDQIFGPVHSNDVIIVASSGATFFGPVATAQTISGLSNGTYMQGYKQNVPIIPMPGTADLNKLKNQALIGSTSIISTMSGSMGQATTRIEFVALDLNVDGDSADDDEGFMKVYQVPLAIDARWVVADTFNYAGTGSSNGVRNSPNCGHYGYASPNHGAGFVTFEDHLTTWLAPDGKSNAPSVTGAGIVRRCYLGGSDSLNLGGAFMAVGDGHGIWLAWPGAVDPRVIVAAGAAQAPYLWPVTRGLNPNFKGVVFVEGKVAVSGKLRGRVTLAATGNIILADDVTYVNNPGAGNCRDILGIFSGDSVVVADNLLNHPFPYILSSSTPVHWDETWDEFIHGFVLALEIFTAERYNPPLPSNTASTTAEPCGGVNSGRGCLFLTGGIIQKQRGAVCLVGTNPGYVKRYSYDQCGLESPPPYFPTTGHFARGHYFEVEPTGFDVATYWSLLTPN